MQTLATLPEIEAMENEIAPAAAAARGCGMTGIFSP
jgi:hypothetical protein